jgi:hypothetical protein
MIVVVEFSQTMLGFRHTLLALGFLFLLYFVRTHATVSLLPRVPGREPDNSLCTGMFGESKFCLVLSTRKCCQGTNAQPARGTQTTHR